MQTVMTCLQELHDSSLLGLAAAVCIVGVYAAFSTAQHAGRQEAYARRNWTLIAILAAGATAWATHMIALLAFKPGIPSAFDPILMVLSLVLVVAGIGLGMAVTIGRRSRLVRLRGGLIIGISVALLHYVGQFSYLVRGTVGFDPALVSVSVLVGVLLFGAATVVAAERRPLRYFAPAVLVMGIAVLHIGGMTALRLEFDPRITLAPYALSLEVVAPIVAGVSLALVLLALMGLRFSIAAAVQSKRDRQRVHELSNMAVEGLAVCDSGRIISVNDSLQQLSGLDGEQLVGRRMEDVLHGVSLDELPEREERDAQFLGVEGKPIPVRVLRRDIIIGKRPQSLVAIRDQRERLRTESRIRKLAFADALTGLSNRSWFSDVFEKRLSDCLASGGSFAVLLIDLDRFKWVNDTLGHAVGDALLQRVANRLLHATRPGDLAARIGGDEFALIVEGGAAAALAVAENVVELIARPYLIGGHAIDVFASVGIAVALQDGATVEVLKQNADLALYRAKHDGGSGYRFFEAEMDERAQARRMLELDLRKAVGRGEFVVYYQPQVDPRTKAYQGAEALVRWRHPQRGLVPPDTFIGLAEEIGLIGVIGEWVLRTACEEALNWRTELSVAVNLSPMQLRDRKLANTVATILRDTGLDPRRLELEVTESAFLQEEGATYQNLAALQKMGIRISMDDFGTGYSSLSYLRRFPFDKLKIDRSFVQQIPDDSDSKAIVRANATLGADLGMSITIEGVETAAQQSFAIDHGCHQVQGYLISRPVPADELRPLLAPKVPQGLCA